MAKLKRKNSRKTYEDQAPWKSIVVNGVRALILSSICIILVSFLLTYSSLPEKVIPAVTIIIATLTVLFASRKASKRIGKRGWLNGLAVSLVYILFLLVGSMIFLSASPVSILIGYWPIVLAGVVGGIWGV